MPYNVIRHEAHTGVTGTFTAAASAGHALKVSGVKSFAPAAAGDITVGTALTDVAINTSGTARIRGDIVPMIAKGAVTAGDQVVPGSVAGTVAKRAAEAAETIVGVAWTTAADGATVYVVVL